MKEFSESKPEVFRKTRIYRQALAVCAVTLSFLLGVSGCSTDKKNADTSGTPTVARETGGPGPFLGECGGLTTAEVLNKIGAAMQTINNASVCEWVGMGGASFNWYRNSPIGRETANMKSSGALLTPVAFSGYRGILADRSDSGICEIVVKLADDFIEWSVNGPSPELCETAKEFARLTVERAKK